MQWIHKGTKVIPENIFTSNGLQGAHWAVPLTERCLALTEPQPHLCLSFPHLWNRGEDPGLVCVKGLERPGMEAVCYKGALRC